MDVTVEVKGLRELEARLQELDALAGQRLLRRVLRKVAKPMLAAAKANAQGLAKSGALARSMGIVSRRPMGAQVVRVSVTSRAKDRTAVYVHNAAYNRRRKGIFYGWMLDQGHAAGSGKRVAGRPWWTPAVSSTQGRATSDFVRELAAAIRRVEARAKARSSNPDAIVPEVP